MTEIKQSALLQSKASLLYPLDPHPRSLFLDVKEREAGLRDGQPPRSPDVKGDFKVGTAHPDLSFVCLKN